MIGAGIDRRMRQLLVPFIAFVALISCLGHKEWRFVVYVIPVLNVAASRAAVWLFVTERELSRDDSISGGRSAGMGDWDFCCA